MLQCSCVARISGSTDQKCDVGTLTSPISMQLVQNEEPESPSSSHQLSLISPRQDEFKHYVIRQQNVWRIRNNFFPLAVVLLPRISPKRHRPAPIRISELE